MVVLPAVVDLHLHHGRPLRPRATRHCVNILQKSKRVAEKKVLGGIYESHVSGHRLKAFQKTFAELSIKIRV